MTENYRLSRGEDDRAGRIHGEMLWFNNTKDFGFIVTVDGERLRVSGAGFRGGNRPQGRCAGLEVTFRVMGNGEAATADDVVFVVDDAPRRARIRRSAGR